MPPSFKASKKDKAPKETRPAVPRKTTGMPTDPLNNTDHRFMQQIMDKGAIQRELFNSKLLTLTKNRNPLLGEETYRENVEYYVTDRSGNNQEYADEAYYNAVTFKGERVEPLGSAVGLVESLRRRKELIESELTQMKKLIEHKKLCLSLTSEYSKPRTLHPALQQTSQLTTNFPISRTFDRQTFKAKNSGSFHFENNSICKMGR